MVADILQDPRKIPKYLDWRECGFITPPRNQRDCGSCYAYSIAGTIEGQLFKNNRKLITLSEQQLVDCSKATGNLGCSGGSLKNTLTYLERSRGIMSGANYPYKAKVKLKNWYTLLFMKIKKHCFHSLKKIINDPPSYTITINCLSLNLKLFFFLIFN